MNTRLNYRSRLVNRYVCREAVCGVCGATGQFQVDDLTLGAPLCSGCVVDSLSAECLLVTVGLFAHPGPELVGRNP